MSEVSLLRVGSVTHHADVNQRGIDLTFLVPSTPPSTVRIAVPTKLFLFRDFEGAAPADLVPERRLVGVQPYAGHHQG